MTFVNSLFSGSSFFETGLSLEHPANCRIKQEAATTKIVIFIFLKVNIFE
jgi:hypothetical protein